MVLINSNNNNNNNPKAQNNAIRTNYIDMKINNTQQNSKCRLFSDKDERVNHRISEYSKLVQNEYEVWLGGKGIPLGIVQEIEIWSYYQMVYAQTKIHPEECDT